MSYVRNEAVTGFTFLLTNKSTGAALTGAASGVSGYYTIDGGTQAALSGTITEEGNGEYSINLTAAQMNGAIIGLLFTHANAVPQHFTIRTIGSPADTSTESTLSLSLTDLRKEIGWYWLGERDSSNWSSDELTQIDEMINSGLRQFYHPAPGGIAPKGHKWSFMEPTTTLTTVAGTADYSLSANFGGMIGIATYASGDNRWAPIETTGESRIRLLRQRDSGTAQSNPTLMAIRPKSSDGSNGQRFELMLWPDPDKAYTVSYRYHALPSKLTVANPYPLGGEAHAETILASCLAVAESRQENNAGIHNANFVQRLQASISYDRNMHTPNISGYNGDGSDRMGISEQNNRYINGDVVTYNGTAFYDSNP
ncbi:hypothetical protein [Acinetobacter sp.]|uniref:phage adaptor protein n=1 Tax=Acinetobacter sp. TaxID=472 RepID=UPI000C0B9417|nr:hypothetical protein [Acinetobacter sp.]MAK30930.1 hypothetical protein [Acinetobacter sp.]|tara:strand:- start:6065 stop:7168 length:1104 start_codon:yes stop_codon:yes gene_type:complete